MSENKNLIAPPTALPLFVWAAAGLTMEVGCLKGESCLLNVC